jgi:hypothetical protein
MMADAPTSINVPKTTFDMIMNYLAERPVKEVYGLVTDLIKLANEQVPAPTVEVPAEPQQ